MPTVTVNRSDLFPPSTSVGIYSAGSFTPGSAPRSAAIATGTTDSGGALSVTDAGLLAGTRYVAYATVGGQYNYAFVRSTLDTHDTGTAVGTGNTTSGSTALASVATTSGTFQIGQRITGPGIPAGTYLQSGSGASWVMSAAATATASSVALRADGAYTWRAKMRRRRVAAGTS